MPTDYWPKLFWLGTAAFVASTLSFIFADRHIAVLSSHWFAGTLVHDWSQVIAIWTASTRVVVIALIIGAIGCWLSLMQRHAQARTFLAIFLSYSIAFLFASTVKFIVARYRPDLFLNEGLYGFYWFSTQHEYTSYPSGHSVINFTLSLSVTLLLWHRARGLALACLLYGGVIAFSRVIVNAHFVGDVAASLAFASWSLSLVLWLLQRHDKHMLQTHTEKPPVNPPTEPIFDARHGDESTS